MAVTDSIGTDLESLMTLRKVIEVAVKILPHQIDTCRELLNQSEIIDTAFSRFILDSRQLTQQHTSNPTNKSSENQPVNSLVASGDHVKDVFVLLKSQTQSIDKSFQYAKAASNHAAFILSEIDFSKLIIDEPRLSKTERDENTVSKLKVKDLVSNSEDNRFKCPVLYVPDIRLILGSLIQISLLPVKALENISGSDDLTQYLPQVIAVTGTNGKTTISQLIAQLCLLSNVKELQNSAVMGTAGNGRLDNLQQASHTTGDALAVQVFLRQMYNEGVDILALEASSHGLDQLRLQGVPVTVAVYTNLSRDHLDYHPDMQDYAQAKARLFDKTYFPQLTHAIINADDEFAPLMIETALKSKLKVWIYSLNADVTNKLDNNPLSHLVDQIDATFLAKTIKPSLNGAEIELITSFGNILLQSPLLGRFNVANLLAAVAGGLALGMNLADMPQIVRQLKGASGRMQRVTLENSPIHTERFNEGCYIVDYAHTPDALTQVLKSLRPHCEGQLWAIFGCGGDRDRGKRPLMAQAGLSLADKVVLTSDNPRSEDPEQILQDMQQDMVDSQHSKTAVIADRREAIDYVVQQASSDDIVVIAGKGHESYQEIKGVRYDFDDREVLKSALQRYRL